jgi:hypothetical protein
MMDFDMQFKELNMLTFQGTLNRESGTDINFMLDRRKMPSLSLMNGVYGAAEISAVQVCFDRDTFLPISDTLCLQDSLANTNLYLRTPTSQYTPSTLATLRDRDFSISDLVDLAKKRTSVMNIAQMGVNQRLNDRWQAGGDISVSNISGTPPSGTHNVATIFDNITQTVVSIETSGPEGYLPGSPASGNTFTLSSRLSASNLVVKRDLSTFSLSLSKSPTSTYKFFYLNNRAFTSDSWTLDSTLRFGLQNTHYLDSQGSLVSSKTTTISPVVRVSYLLRSNVTLDSELGADFSYLRYNAGTNLPSDNKRAYLSTGFRWDF